MQAALHWVQVVCFYSVMWLYSINPLKSTENISPIFFIYIYIYTLHLIKKQWTKQLGPLVCSKSYKTNKIEVFFMLLNIHLVLWWGGAVCHWCSLKFWGGNRKGYKQKSNISTKHVSYGSIPHWFESCCWICQ